VQMTDEGREANGLAAVTLSVPELGAAHRLKADLQALFRDQGQPQSIALDLLLFASVCYGIDSIVPRAASEDGWTRDLQVSIPVSDPQLWETATDDVQTMLRFLTGDEWDVSFRAPECLLYDRTHVARRRRRIPTRRANAVCLFSGGLDSLVGAIDLLTAGSLAHLALVGHHSDVGGPAKAQRDLHEGLARDYRGRSQLRQVRVAVVPSGPETSSRSRSLLFLVLGLCVAASQGPTTPLVVPENGLIAVNMPLTRSRTGSLSTRTTHPFFLSTMRRVIDKLGIRNSITNPYALQTKGELVADCRNPELLCELFGRSVSCAHPTRRQHWVRKGAAGCGYCIPCLFRRGALHASGLDVGTDHGIDVCAKELRLKEGRAADIRALLDCLSRRKSETELGEEIAASGPIPAQEHQAIVSMVARGFEEIRVFLVEKGPHLVQAYKAYSGWAA